MHLNFFSFFFSHEEFFLEFNTDIFETNLINISILIGVLLYANKVSFSKTLSDRQLEIIQVIENAQKDVTNASNYYSQAEKGFSQSFFWLQSWKMFYEQEKKDFVTKKYQFVKQTLLEAFETTENFDNSNFHKRTSTFPKISFPTNKIAINVKAEFVK